MSSTPALAFNDVSKHYRGFFRSQWVTALRDFSLRVERGEIFGFLGPNGAGKTTAMHLAIGLMFPSSGRGEMLGHQFGHAPTRRRVGACPNWCPSISPRPLLGNIRPIARCMAVVFPAPLGPRKPKISPRSTRKEKSRSAVTHWLRKKPR